MKLISKILVLTRNETIKVITELLKWDELENSTEYMADKTNACMSGVPFRDFTAQSYQVTDAMK
jgi:hypothetical protein